MRIINVEEDWVVNLVREIIDYNDRLTIMRDNWRNRIRGIRKKEGDSKADKEIDEIPLDDLDANNVDHIRRYKSFLEDEIPKKKRDAYMEEKRGEYRGYDILRETREMLYNREMFLLKEAVDLFSETELWSFCERVKGLGKVAGLTYLGYRK